MSVISLKAVGLKPNDLLKVSWSGKRIGYDMQVRDGWQDGLDVVLSEGSKISLELNGNTAEALSFVRVGDEK